MNILKISGKIVSGLGFASGNREEYMEIPSNIYNDRSMLISGSSVAMQVPCFKKAGIDNIENMHEGTINLGIAPKEFEVLQPDYEITCEWTDGVEETFWLVGTKVLFEGKEYNGYIYYPCISEIHPPNDSVVELLTEKISGIEYGKDIAIEVSDQKIRLKK